MESLLVRAGCFVAIIALGALLRRAGMFQEKDFGLLSKISLRITLPCAIITGFAGKTIAPSMLLIPLLGLGMGCLCMAVAFIFNLKNSPQRRAFELLNITGCNVGAMTIPFVQSFLGPGAVVVASLFDVGNAAMGLGTSYGVAAAIQDGKGFSFKRIGRALLTSVPLITYIVMTVLTLLKLQLPAPVMEFADIVGSANTFVAMLMIGVGFRLSADRSQLGRLLKMAAMRYSIAAALAALFWFVLPFDLLTRQTLVILAFSPIITAAPAFTGELKNDVGLSSAFNSLCMIISIVIFLVLLGTMV